uniref:DUF4371 domain-containing protein n=1 Tax=Sparus aurata TaxID=8175 RepID=A0A671W871_SPAAU
MSEKRKSTDGSSGPKKKTRQYLESYLDFGFMEGQDGYRPECVICGEKLADDSMRPNKLRRHQETKHHKTIGESREYFERKKQLALSRRSTDIRSAFERAGSDLQRATEASFDCSLLIAKAKKPHSIGEQLIKPACLKIVERLCGPQVVAKLKAVPLSDNTVKSRIDQMAADCQNQLHEKLRNVNFAIQLDETTKVSDESVLIVYVQFIDGEDLKQDILMSTNLLTTTGQDIFVAVDSYLSSNNLPYENLVACCTDRAAAMMGKNKGFNSRLKEKAPGCVIFPCMLHRQALEFLQDHNRPLCEQLTDAFWIKTAYLADTFTVYNETNKPDAGGLNPVLSSAKTPWTLLCANWITDLKKCRTGKYSIFHCC